MKSIATLSPDLAQKLAGLLRSGSIPFQTRTTTEESGLDVTEIFVEDDSFYERACAIAESWQERELVEEAERSKWRCPKCRSPHLVFAGDETNDNLFRCDDRGCMVAI